MLVPGINLLDHYLCAHEIPRVDQSGNGFYPCYDIDNDPGGSKMDFNLIFRFSILAVLVIAFGISMSFRHEIREMERRIKSQEEGWSILTIRLVFLIPLLVVLLLNILYPKALFWSKIDLPLYLRVIGLGVAVMCVPLLWWVFRNIGSFISNTIPIEDDIQQVIKGPYRIVRHPLYATSLLLLISVSLVFGDWIIFGYSIVGIIAFRLLVIPAEEKQLLDELGEDYECYQSRTGALFPWIR
jgi:protein-S-isoprenylcysteine O-methyltransferase Ste14